MRRIPGLLIVEGNANRLQREGASRRIDRIEEALGGLVAAGALRIKRVRIRNESDLELARAIAPVGRYDAVLLVAHSNLDGAEATPTRGLTWAEIGSLLSAVEPRAVLAMSCMAASAGPTRALFDTIPTLRAVGGSPATLTVPQAELAILELLSAAYGTIVSPELSALASLYNAVETGGLVVWRHRAAFERASDDELLVLDLLAILGKTLIDIDRVERPRRRLPAGRRVSPRKLSGKIVGARP